MAERTRCSAKGCTTDPAGSPDVWRMTSPSGKTIRLLCTTHGAELAERRWTYQRLEGHDLADPPTGTQARHLTVVPDLPPEDLIHTVHRLTPADGEPEPLDPAYVSVVADGRSAEPEVRYPDGQLGRVDRSRLTAATPGWQDDGDYVAPPMDTHGLYVCCGRADGHNHDCDYFGDWISPEQRKWLDQGKCIWITETGMTPGVVRFCEKPYDPDSGDLDEDPYCREHSAEVSRDEDRAAYWHYCEPGGPDYDERAAARLPHPDDDDPNALSAALNDPANQGDDWLDREPAANTTTEGTTGMAAATFEQAKHTLTQFVAAAEDYLTATDKASGDLARAGLPPDDLRDVGTVAEAAQTLAAVAGTAHDNLVAIHQPIQDAILAAGGAADEMAWYRK